MRLVEMFYCSSLIVRVGYSDLDHYSVGRSPRKLEIVNTKVCFSAFASHFIMSS